MLSHFFRSRARIDKILCNPSGEQLNKFSIYLYENGYSAVTSRRHIRSAEHLGHWMHKQALSIDDIDYAALERFGKHLARCKCCHYSRAHPVDILTGARLFAQHSQDVDTSAVGLGKPAYVQSALLQTFCQWMREQRGTSDATLYNYGIPIEEFILSFGEDMCTLDARSLRRFVLERSRTKGWAATQTCTTALRMFIRFLIAEGRCPAILSGAIPGIAHWRLSTLPRYLPPDEVERLIESCDLQAPSGKRDRAILLLLARLGLRAGDIVQMKLQDIDWKGAWIHVSGKSRREARLPLTQEMGEAIMAYVQQGRPCAHTDVLFLRSRAPFREFASHAAVSVLVSRAMNRAGIKRPCRGAAHLLRHSLASSMLRQGASLQEISVLLRHRSIETTQIYAKVDVNRLLEIAQPWPEAPSC